MTSPNGFLIAYFNPRSREGSDVRRIYTLFLYPDFNPRSREGSDAARKMTAYEGL